MHCIELIWKFWKSCPLFIFACGCDTFACVYYYHNDNWRCLDQFSSWQICEREAFEDWEKIYANTCKFWKRGSWCFIEGDIINYGGHLGWCWCPTLFPSYKHYCIFHSTNSRKVGYNNPLWLLWFVAKEKLMVVLSLLWWMEILQMTSKWYKLNKYSYKFIEWFE